MAISLIFTAQPKKIRNSVVSSNLKKSTMGCNLKPTLSLTFLQFILNYIIRIHLRNPISVFQNIKKSQYL